MRRTGFAAGGLALALLAGCGGEAPSSAAPDADAPTGSQVIAQLTSSPAQSPAQSTPPGTVVASSPVTVPATSLGSSPEASPTTVAGVVLPSEQCSADNSPTEVGVAAGGG
jgi:hypothetical protein